jgi:three-Cys-motif partner protein
MPTPHAFADRAEQARARARIVANYFDAWARAVAPAARKGGQTVQYVDLFAGPGRHEDGSESAALLVLRKAIANRPLHDLLVAVFNDPEPAHADALRAAVAALPGVGWLKHGSQVYDSPVDEEAAAFLARPGQPPTLAVLDPPGHPGLSAQVLQAVLKEPGCDGLFFFHFDRADPAAHAGVVEGHVTALFGAEDARRLWPHLSPGLRPQEREAKLMEVLTTAVRREQGKLASHFASRDGLGSPAGHHLVLTTKEERNCSLLKEVMARESAWAEGGVPPRVRPPAARERTLFDALDDPLAQLGQSLLEAFAGPRLRVDEVFERHGQGGPFTLANYKDALKRLEEAGRIAAAPPAGERRARTMADHVVVEFPPKEG